jgi:hypothetical protein
MHILPVVRTVLHSLNLGKCAPAVEVVPSISHRALTGTLLEPCRLLLLNANHLPFTIRVHSPAMRPEILAVNECNRCSTQKRNCK